MPLAWYALIGLFAGLLINRTVDCWLALVPQQCGLTRHPLRQWLVLVGVPAFFVFIAATIGNDRLGLVVSLAGALFILLGVIDLEHRRVPDIIVLPATLFALAVHWQAGQLLISVAGALVALLFFTILFLAGRKLFGPEALGWGDVKLAMLMGAIFGLGQLVYVLGLGILLAGLASAALLISGRAKRGDTIPYGSFLSLSGMLVLLFFPLIVDVSPLL